MRKLSKALFENRLSQEFDIRPALVAKNTVLNFLGLALPLFVGVLTIPVVIRWLGTERFGVFSLAWVVFGYFGIFDLGLGAATTRFVSAALGKGQVEEVPIYVWTTVLFQGILGVVGALVLASLTPLIVGRGLNVPEALIPETKSVFYILAASLPIVLLTESFRGVLEALQRFDLVNAVKIPSSIINYLLPLLGILLGMGLPGIVLLLVASRAATFMLWILLCFRVLPILKRRIAFQKQRLLSVLSFGAWVTVSNVIYPLLTYLDRFIIGSLLTVTAVTLYTAPYELVTRLGIIPASLLMALFPTFSALMSRNAREQAASLFGRSVRYLLLCIGSIVILLVSFAPPIIGVWLGKPFVLPCAPVFRILALGFFANALARIPYGFLHGIGRADVPAKFHIVELALYVPLSWMLIKAWGIRGAAIAWALRVAFDMILLFLAARRLGGAICPATERTGFIRVLVSLLAFTILGLLGERLFPNIAGLFIVFTFMIGFLWFISLNKYERDWLKGLFRRLPAHTALKEG